MPNRRNENTYQKQPEKPSFCSRRVVKTYKKNEFENISLQKNLSRIEKERFNSGMIRLDNVDKLLKISAKIKKTKTSIAVSPDRRRFLLENGFKINCREFNTEDFMEIIDDATLPKKQRAKSAPPRLTKEKPMLRLNDYITAKQEEKKKKEDQHNIEDNDNANDVDNDKFNTEHSNEREEQLDKKLSDTFRICKAPIFRTIIPPLKGREVWKVHEEKEQEEIMRKLSISHRKYIHSYRPASALGKRLKDQKEVKRTKSPSPVIETEINQEVDDYRMRVLSKHKLNQEIIKKTNKKLLKNRHKSATVRPTTQTFREAPVIKETFPVSIPRRQRPRTEVWGDPSKGSRNNENKSDIKDWTNQSHRKLRSSTFADASFAQMQVTVKGQSLKLFVSKFK